MSFLSPDRLWLLLIPLLGLVAYLVAVRRKPKYALRFSDVELLEKVAPDRPGWRRHVPAVAVILATSLLLVAFARPVMAVPVPVDQATVVLAVDVSLSMDADDVDPVRIDAAKAAARNFVDLAPEDLQIGLVAFAGVALPAVAPTTDREALTSAIDRLTLAEGTAIGEAIYTAIDLVDVERDGEDGEVPAAIVVLSDGETTVGRSEVDAAAEASAASLPVSTIAFGTREGSIVYEGEVVPVPANEGALREVAETTGGQFFAVASAEELQQILDDVGSEVGIETEEREVWEWFLFGGVAVLVVAAGASLVWFSRIP
jgi:Ca-activated chloride channel family protein